MSITAAQLIAEVRTLGTATAKADLLGVGVAVGTVAALIGVGLGVVAVKAAADFQQGMARLVTGAGDTTDNMKKMGQAILGISVDTGVASGELTKAMYLIISSGQRGAQALNTLSVASKGAVIEQASVVDVANVLSGVMTNYGTKIFSATDFMNGLIRAVQLGKITLQDLAVAMGPIDPIAKSVGVSFSDLAAAMTTQTNAMIPAARAATGLRFMMLALENPTKKATTAMAAMGLNSIAVANEMKVSLPLALQMIYNAAKKAGPEGSVPFNRAISDMVGGLRSFTAFTALTGPHMADFAKNADLIAAAMKRGSAQVLGWTVAQGNFNVQLDRAKAAGMALFIALGTQLLPVLGKLLAAVLPLITNFTTWVTNAAPLSTIIDQIGTAFSLVFGPVQKTQTVLKPLLDSFDRATGVFKQVHTAATPMLDSFDRASAILGITKTKAQELQPALNPFIAIFQGISTTIQTFISIWNKDLKPIFNYIKDQLTPSITYLGIVIKTQLYPAWQQFWTALQPSLPALKTLALIIGGILLLALIAMAKGFIIGATAVALLAAAALKLSAAWMTAMTFIQTVTRNIVKFFTDLYHQLVGGSIIPDLMNAIVKLFSGLPGRIVGALGSLLGSVGGMFTSLKTRVLSIIDGMASALYQSGLHIVQQIGAGIQAGIGAAVTAAQNVASAVANILKHSTPKEGPLRGDDLWGAHLVDNLITGMQSRMPALKSMITALASPIAVGINPTIGGGLLPSGVAFTPQMSQPVIHIHNHPPANHFYLDGHEIVDRLGPHIARSVRRQTASRRPV